MLKKYQTFLPKGTFRYQNTKEKAITVYKEKHMKRQHQFACL